MKHITLCLLIASLGSTHLSCSDQYTQMMVTEKEAKMIKTHRVLNSLQALLKPIEKSHDWSIRHAATQPTRTEMITLSAPLFAQALTDIIEQYATCYEITTEKSFGFVHVQEVCIVDRKDADIQIISNPEFMALLEKAIKFFEAETSTKPFVEYKEMFVIQTISGHKLTLHEIKDAIVRAKK